MLLLSKSVSKKPQVWIQSALQVPCPPTGSTAPATLATPVASGNMIIGWLAWNDVYSTLSTITDDKGNSYSILQNIFSTAIYSCTFVIFTALNLTNGPTTITATFTASIKYPQIGIDEYQGISTIDTSRINVQESSLGTTVDAINSGSITTTVANELVWGVATSGDGVPVTLAGTGWTRRMTTTDSSGYTPATEDRVLATPGPIAATFTSGSASNIKGWFSGIVAFK